MEETINFNACIENWLPLLSCLFRQVEIDNFYSRTLLTQRPLIVRSNNRIHLRIFSISFDRSVMNTLSIRNMGFTGSDISVAVFKSVSQICVQVFIIPLSSLHHA